MHLQATVCKRPNIRNRFSQMKTDDRLLRSKLVLNITQCMGGANTLTIFFTRRHENQRGAPLRLREPLADLSSAALLFGRRMCASGDFERPAALQALPE